ncbi:MAG: hypothetical protein H0W84_00405 [Bacteroidetes bacterium]|nr:hypothetical protein [Bacteroidota bacterium]
MRILLLSLYYPPLNTIAALRLKAFHDYLTEFGHTVDVITRYYDKEQQEGKSMLLGKISPLNFAPNYIRNENVIYTNFDSANTKLSFVAKLPPIIKGIYNYMQVDIFHFGWIKYVFDAYETEFKSNKYDYIIASYGPPIVMKLAKELSEKYNTPYVIDFRDSYIDERDKGIHLWIKRIIQHRILKNAKALIFSTDGMNYFFNTNATSQLKILPSCVVYNGVDLAETSDPQASLDDNLIKQFNEIKNNCSLLLLHTGTIYKEQNILFFINSVERYNEQNKKQVVILFLGLADNKTEELPSRSFIHKFPKTSHATALLLQKKADVLLLPIWKDRYTGFSGKTMEYLFSENFIITSPKPQADLKTFFDISPNVHITKDYDNFVEIIEGISTKKYIRAPLKNGGKLLRSYWIKKMSDFLLKIK